jgi:hypothetical protein
MFTGPVAIVLPALINTSAATIARLKRELR